MLVNLNIKDFAIVEHLNLEFKGGMISLTGETGAGKSIVLGAIGVIVGDKVNKDAVRSGAEKAIISATFDISKLPKVKSFLEKYDYIGDEDECIIRRVIRRDGKSSSFINDASASMSKLKELGESLVEIHGQHQHQSISKDKKQLEMLDSYLNLKDLRNEVSLLYKKWKLSQKNYENVKNNFEEMFNSYQLLSYQLKELKELNLSEGEFEELEQELNHLESASSVISNCEGSLSILNEGDGVSSQSVISLVNQVHRNISSLEDDLLKETLEMLEIASINLEEASNEITRYQEKFEINPEKEIELKERIREINKISEKMNVYPENIHLLKSELEEKLETLNYSEDVVDEAKLEMEKAYDCFIDKATVLSQQRREGSEKMSYAVNEEAVKLNLSEEFLKIEFEESVENITGIDSISFYIRPNLGQPYQPLKKIASGGEMSRISLAIQVVALRNDHIPTMIFDEVDTGLSGETGNVVGRMLRAVGSLGQVMCVTHLPQVASQGHNHFFVSKKNVKRDGKEITISSIKPLTEVERVHEIARMIGGDISSKESFENAKSMLLMSA